MYGLFFYDASEVEMLYIYMVWPHAYVWAVVWYTSPGGKLQTSVNGQCVFPGASSGVTVCSTDM